MTAGPSTIILVGHALDRLREIPEESVHCVVTSPPYWLLRNYGIGPLHWDPVSYAPIAGSPDVSVPSWTGSLGDEPTVDLYVGHLVQVFREVRRILRKDGTLWLNIGDGYTSGGRTWRAADKKNTGRAMDVRPHTPQGLKPKDLIGIPWRLAFALQADGWILRSEIVWAKLNPMPESVKDRPTGAHEKIFLFSKSGTYFYDYESSLEPAKAETWHDMTSAGPYLAPGQPVQKFGLRAKVPSGWDTEKRTHGSVHPEGRNEKTVWKMIGDPAIRRDLGGPKQRLRAEGLRPDFFFRNPRNVWEMATRPFPEAHFAVFPEELPRRALRSGVPKHGVCGECRDPYVLVEEGRAAPSCGHPETIAGGPVSATVLDPFGGAGTTGLVAQRMGLSALLIEQSPKYAEMARRRLVRANRLFGKVRVKKTEEGETAQESEEEETR